MTGSKPVDHWTSGTVYECIEIAGSPQGSPPAAHYGVESTCTYLYIHYGVVGFNNFGLVTKLL
jgi:hypothetical protein